MLKSIFFGALFWALSHPLFAQIPGKYVPPGDYELAGISVEGIEFGDKNALVSLSGLEIGQKITVPGDAFADAIKKLWKQNIFADISIEAEKILGEKLYVVIKVEERPRIAKYTFVGISKSQADDLREKVKLVRGQRFTESKRRNVIRIIKNFYYEKGFFNTKVDITTRPDDVMQNGIVLVISINKGKRVKIGKIIIDGAEKIKTRKYLAKLKNTKPIKFWRFWKASKYIPAKFGEDKSSLIEFMQSKGLRDARILKDSVIATAPNRINLHIKLYEGNTYYFRNITWLGNFKYTSGFLDTLLGIKKGQVYNTQLLQRRLTMDPNGSDISSLYLDDGHLFFRIDPVEIAVDRDSIDLEIRMAEGPQATYDKIIIEGNTKTSDHVVLREIRTYPGNKFSRAEIIRTQREILNLGFFNQENMQINPLPNPEKGTVDIKYVVEEKPSDQLFFQAGWGGRPQRNFNNNFIGGTGLIGTVGLQFNNFSARRVLQKSAWKPLPSGDGQKLSIRAQLNGAGFQNYAVSFIEPWLGGFKPNSLGVNANYSMQRSFFSNYRINIVGISADFGRRMKWPDDFFRSFTSLGYRFYDVRGAGSIFGGVDRGQVNIVSLKQTFDRTSIDVPIFPTRGSVLNFSVEATPPWSLFIKKDYANLGANEKYRLLEFHKWKFSTETYTKLTNVKLPFVLFARALTGYLGYFNPAIGLSPFERFYLGGDGLMGFNLDGREIIAQRGYQDFQSVGDNAALGHAIFNKFTVELRQALSLSPTATVWVHGFAEAGNAWGKFANYNPFHLRRSVGGGVRIFLPIFGLLGIDLGYGLDPPSPLSRRFNFHFMIGQQF